MTGMNHLLQNMPDGAEGLVDYFSKTYVTGTFRPVQPAQGQVGVTLQLVPPRFPPELWIVGILSVVILSVGILSCEIQNLSRIQLMKGSH